VNQPAKGARVVLALLLLAYIFNFLDRQMLGILAQPIKADLRLTDTEFGAVGGLAFALLFSLLGLPLAMLADRTGRSAVVAGSLAVWSAFTALCGTAAGFTQLFLYRLGVGVGEAGGVAPSVALIADYFPPERRARAMAIYYLGVPLGLAGGTLIGVYIAHAVNWRAAFVVMGLAGLILSPVLRFFVRDLPRRAPESPPRLSAVLPSLARKPAFWLLALASAASSLTGYGLALWTPSVLQRSFDLDLLSTGNFLASLLLIGGCAGVFAGGWFADRLGRLDRGWYARLPALAWLITAPAFALGLLAPNLWIAWPFLLVANALNILWLGPVTTAVQHLVQRPMRATAAGSFLLVNNLIGLGVGPLLMGGLSDMLKSTYGVDSLRYAAAGCTLFYLVAAVLMLLSIKHLRASWIDDNTSDPTI
jgi:MFS family permease